MTGLAAAHRLCELAPADTLQIELFEASARLGGIVGTIERAGYLIDTGADSFITNKPGAIGLCQRLGLESRLQATEAKYRGALVLADGRPVPVPEGFQLLSPTAMWPVLCSSILSPWGKVRLAWERFVPRSQSNGDETLASFVRRRFGTETLERIVQPLVGGIYTSDPEQLSLAATMPRFLEMEQQHGSLIKALCSGGRKEDPTSSGARYGLFAGLRGGMQDLVDALVAAITPRVTVHDCTPVSSWRPVVEDGVPRSVVVFADGRCQTFDAVIVTLPAYRTAELIATADAALASVLNTIEYASSAIVVSGHKLMDIADPLQAFGLVIPHRERRRILAVSFSSRKFPNRAPAGHVLLRTFVGGAMQPEFAQLDDQATLQLVQEELAATLGVRGAPEFTTIVRYPRAMPQFTFGHLDRVAEIERLTAAHPGLAIAGNAYRGVGVPDAIFSGEQAAERVFNVQK